VEEAIDSHANACGHQLSPTAPAARAPTTRGGGSGGGGAVGVAAAPAFDLDRAFNFIFSGSALKEGEEEKR